MITSEEMADIERRWMGASQTKTEGVLTIACDRYYPPFTMLTSSGRPAGILIDFWRLWSEKNDRRIEFIFDDWEKTIQLIRDGKADLHSGLFKTRMREEFLSFSVPIFAAQDKLAFKTDQEPLSMDELKGKAVGVIAGSAEETELKETHPDIVLSTFIGYRELLDALRDGEVLAAYDVGVTLQQAIEEMGLQGEIKVSTESGAIYDIFAGVLKGNADLLKEVNQGISKITEQEIRDIEARWVSNPDLRQYSGKARPLVLTAEEKQWLKEHPHIRLGIDPHFMPFEAVNPSGKYEGISSSHVSLISEKLGVDMTPVKDLSWQKVMDAAKAGEVDVLPCLVQTPERSEFLVFTRPYLDFQTVAVTRKDAPFMADLKGLKDVKVAVVEGYFVHDMLKRDFPEMKLVLVNDIDQGLKAVAEGKAAAYVDNSASIIYALNRLNLTDLKVAITTPYNSSLCFGVRKDWPQLATILEKALQSIPQEEREKIANSWINVRFAERTDWGFLLKIGIAIALAIGLILTIIIIWNRRMAKEVGERKRAEQESLRSERKINVMSQAVEDALVMINGKGKVLFWNPAAERLFGYTEAEAMGMDFHQIAAPEEYHDKIYKGLKQFAKTGEGAVLGTTTEITARNRKGELFPAEVTLSSFKVDEEWFAVGTVRDITERKKAEDRLRFTQTTVDKAALNIFWVETETGIFTYANEAACHSLGYTHEELMGMHMPQIDEEFTEEKFAGLMAVLKEHSHVETQGIHRSKDGHLLNVSLSIVLTRLENREMIAVFSRDITDKLKAEEELKKRLEELERFSRLTINREEKMIQLKEEINTILEEAGKEKKYKIVE